MDACKLDNDWMKVHLNVDAGMSYLLAADVVIFSGLTNPGTAIQADIEALFRGAL